MHIVLKSFQLTSILKDGSATDNRPAIKHAQVPPTFEQVSAESEGDKRTYLTSSEDEVVLNIVDHRAGEEQGNTTYGPSL